MYIYLYINTYKNQLQNANNYTIGLQKRHKKIP